MKFKAVVFDLFGTIIYRRIKTNFSKGLNFPKNADSIIMSGEFENVKAMCERFKLTPEKAELEQAENFIISDTQSICELHDAMRSIEYAKSQGYKVFALSNLATPWAKAFKKLPVSQMFDDIFLSCETGYLKPNSEAYTQILSKYDLNPSEVLIVGDTPNADIFGSWNNGIYGIHRNQNMIESIKQAEVEYDWQSEYPYERTLTLNNELVFRMINEDDHIVGYDYRYNRLYKFENTTIAKYAFKSSIEGDRTYLQKYDVGELEIKSLVK